MADHPLLQLTPEDRKRLCAFLRHSAAVDEQFPGIARDAPDKRRWADAIEAVDNIKRAHSIGGATTGEQQHG